MMNARKLREKIRNKREQAVKDMVIATEKGHTSVYWTLKGVIDAYTDVMSMIREEMENEMDA